jgi:putative transposase
MKKQNRLKAVQRFNEREEPDEICASLGCSRSWLYKWAARFDPDDPAWTEDRSRLPLSSPLRTPDEIEKIVELVRLDLYNNDLMCGKQVIQ